MNNHQEIDSKIDRNFTHLALSVNRHLMDHLRRISTELEMDFQTIYIWGTLAQMSLSHTRINLPLLTHPNSDQSIDPQDFSPSPVRLTDLSQVTRFPKETTRRKLEYLRQRGKVDRNKKGEWWIAEGSIDEPTREFTKETIRRYLRMAEELHWILNTPKK